MATTMPFDVDGVDRWRDPAAEREALGDLLQHPSLDRVEAYVAAGFADDCFDLEPHRLVWRAMRALAADGIQPDISTVRGRLQDSGELEHVTVARLYGLADGIPRFSDANIRARGERLRRLSDCRRVYYLIQRLLGQLSENPLIIRNGAISYLIEQLQDIERSDPRGAVGEIPLLDDGTAQTSPGRMSDRGTHYGADADRALRRNRDR